MKKIIFWLGIIGALLFVVTSILAGLGIEGYSHIGQYISESYATGMPNAERWQYLYMASGIFLFLFGILSSSSFFKKTGVKIGFVIFSIFYGLGTLATGIFPCDIGCVLDAENPSLSQFVHNTAGALIYTVVPLCLLVIGFSLRKKNGFNSYSKFTIVCGLSALLFVAILFGNPEGALKGLFQRIIEMSILSWVIYSSFFVKRL